MKILYYTFVLGSKHGGNSHAFQFLNHLRNYSEVSEVLVFPEVKKEIKNKKVEGKASILKKNKWVLIPRLIKRNLGNYSELYHFIKSNSPDVIIIRPDHNFLQIPRIRKDFPSIILASEINSSSIDESYRNIPFRSYFKRLEKKAYQKANLNFFVSDYLLESIMGPERNPKRDFIAINGTDPGKFHRKESVAFYKKKLGIPQDFQVIGYMGTLDFDKRIDLLIHSFSNLRIKYPNIFLFIIGDGPDRFNAERLLSSLKLEANSRITGWVDYEKVQESLFAVDIAVHHHANSYQCPLKVFDYLAAGIPTVAPSIPFIVKNFNSEKHLIIAEPQTKTIEAAITDLITNPDKATSMAERGKKLVLERFTWKKNADFIFQKIKKFYE